VCEESENSSVDSSFTDTSEQIAIIRRPSSAVGESTEEINSELAFKPSNNESTKTVSRDDKRYRSRIPQ